MRNPVRQAVEKINERMTLEEEQQSPIARLNHTIYKTCVSFYGIDNKEEDGFTIGDIEILVNGETGEVEEIPIYGGFENEELVTPKDFLLWANTYADVYRHIKRDVKILALALHYANQQEEAEVVIEKTDENDYAHVVYFHLKGTAIHFHYNIPKQDAAPSLVAKVQDQYNSTVDITTPVLTHWDSIKEKLENHPKIRLHVVTGS